MSEVLKKQPFGCILYYYVTDSGKAPVQEFVESLGHKTQRKFFFIWTLLQEHGRCLAMPHARYLGERDRRYFMKLISVNQHLQEKLKDPYFKELWELEEQKLVIVNEIVAYRIKHKLSQKKLAQKVGVTQQHISKIESGDFESVMTLEKVLLSIGYTVQIRMVPLKPLAAGRLLKALRDISAKEHVTRLKSKVEALKHLDKP